MSRGFLGQTIRVLMDRPLGSRHPKHGFVYPVNYGYVPGTLAPDGKELDAYVLGIDEPLASYEGPCIAIIHRLNDDDDKLVVVPEGVRLTDAEIREQTVFQERFFETEIIRSRRVLIDCGANVGAVLEDFIKTRPGYEFYAFEPNSDLIPQIREKVRNYPEVRVTVYDQAVWVHDGVVDFYLGHHETSTLLRGKHVSERYQQQIDYDNPRQVTSVDLSGWLKATCCPHNYVVIKMDIEGAEYAVLEKMIADGTIHYVDELFVEWHFHKISTISKERHHALYGQLKNLVNLYRWKR